MHDDSPSKHALGPNELDEVVGDAAVGVAMVIGFEVAEVADMAIGVGRGAVLFAEGVDWEKERVRGRCIGRGGRGRVGVGSCGGVWWIATYSEDQRLCSHLCCRRIDGRACRARRRGRCRGCRR